MEIDNKKRDEIFVRFVADVFERWLKTNHEDIFNEAVKTGNGELIDRIQDEFVEWFNTKVEEQLWADLVDGKKEET